MSETEIVVEVAEDPKPSTKRQIAAVAATAGTSIVLGMVAQVVIGKLASVIQDRIIKPKPQTEETE